MTSALSDALKAFAQDKLQGGTHTDFIRLGDLAIQASRLEEELEDALRGPWPAWAEGIIAALKTYGVDPGPYEGWSFPEDLELWVEGCLEHEQRRIEALETKHEKIVEAWDVMRHAAMKVETATVWRLSEAVAALTDARRAYEDVVLERKAASA